MDNAKNQESESSSSRPADAPDVLASPSRPGRVRRFIRLCFRLCFVFLFLLALAAAGFYVWATHDTRRPGAGPPILVEIAPGDSLLDISRGLDDAGVVRPWPLTVMLAMAIGERSQLKHGRYAFVPGSSPRLVLRRLSQGPDGGLSSDIRVTLPEGWTVRQIAERLVDSGVLADAESFLALCVDTQFLRSIGVEADEAEGYLFPDTYFFAPGVGARVAIERMTSRFLDVAASLERPGGNGVANDNVYPLTFAQTVVLASIIERESRLAEEFPRVSSVYHNRLRRGKRLESCATVRHAIGGQWSAPLRLEDLRVDSPYNTYRCAGLPPGAICNPGREAMEAALRPEKTDFLFYVYKGRGRHVFSRTLAEHEKARSLYKDAWKFSAGKEE